jgi:hypothetical protein
MKARWIIGFAILTVGAVAYSLRSGPPPVAEIIDRCFGYRPKDEPQIVARKSHVPLAIHGPGYEEHTTVRLSPTDYRELVGRLLADPSFEKRKNFAAPDFTTTDLSLVKRRSVSGPRTPHENFHFPISSIRLSARNERPAQLSV